MTRAGLCLAALGALIASAASAQAPAPAAFRVVSPPKATPETFAGSIVGGFRSACPESFAAHGFGPTRFGDQDAYVALASCGSVGTDRYGETALIVAVKGRSDCYTLQWAERTPAAGKPAIDEAKWQERLRQLQPIRFCPIVPGEAAPYPNCATKG
ncbi:hypothetical protein ACF1BQ_013935 [Bradyrhizobium sp. RDT10]